MKEKSTVHHHAEIIGNNGSSLVRLYSTDDLGHVWGEEFESVGRANTVLGRRRLGLSLLSATISASAYSLPLVLDHGVFKNNKFLKAAGGVAVVGLGKGLLDWQQGINSMKHETQGRINALEEAQKRASLT